MNRHCEKCEYRHEANERSPGFICECPCHKPTDKETSGVFICRTKDTTGGEETHSACQKRIKEEGGKARCCHCVPHKDCEINSTPKVLEDWIWIETKGEEIVKTLSSAFLKEIPSKEAAKIIRIALQEATQRGRDEALKEID